MLKKHLYKYILLVLAFSLTVILIMACAGSRTDNFASEDTLKSSLNSSYGKVDTGPLGRYNPTIDISFVRGIDEDFAKNVLPKTPGETIQDNRWLRLYRDELGINVKYAWAVRGNETSDVYTQRINVTLASGNLPDVTLVNPAQLRQLVDSGMIEDMTEYFDKYASPLTREVYNQEGTATLDSATINGKLMAIPEPYSFVEAAQYIWIRNDWLTKLNLQAPKSMDELLKVAQAFTTMDPDRNGKKDTFGVAITKDLYGGGMGIEGFFAGYHAYPNMWVEDASGNLVWGSTLLETKTALGKLAEMYKAGELDREFGVKDGSKVAEAIAAGKVGIEFGAQWSPMYPLISSFNNDHNADWTGYPLVSADSKKAMVPLKYNQTRIFAVKKGYPHPEALVKMINMHLEKNWGKTADFNRYYMPIENEGVGVWKFSPVVPTPPYKNLDAFLAIDKAREKNNPNQLKGEPKAIQTNLDAFYKGDITKWGWEKIYGRNGVFKILESYKANDQLLPDKFVGPSTNTMAEKKAVMDMMEKEVFIKIIMGAAPIDEFDKFVSDWYKIGGKEITQEVNQWYEFAK
ncbi:extracellular solute-binding protein [Ruminiclostridium cellobioparum]|uniref:extracellular solute-binding protein n=1 Tax=Ruminiclostridium cellobioparum TaxID=29355 RepID=UPI0028A98448|nr:extracellular solute-binding protein [Ruminiclostridium cellobioparum]